MIYTLVLSEETNETNIQPGIYSLKKLFEDKKIWMMCKISFILYFFYDDFSFPSN